MKCCLFGTVRMDIHIFDELKNFDEYDEIKLDEIAMMLGGSVYYTASVLDEYEYDVALYTLNVCDAFSDFIKLSLSRQGINYILSKRDQNKTATTMIFVDGEGGKKMMSYDGKRQDDYVLDKISQAIRQYDLFYTSFYEINQKNYLKLAEVMGACPCVFLDLSPLLYAVDAEIVEQMLEKTHILSGTADEFKVLLSKVGEADVQSLKETYGLKYVFVKQGKNGATMYWQDRNYSYKPKHSKASRDTTGCGDTFNAGVIRGIIDGLSEEEMLSRAVEMATTIAYDGFDLKNLREKNC